MVSYRQSLKDEEKILSRSLAAIYDSVIDVMALNLKAGSVTWTEVQRLYRRRTNDAIRASVEEMYRLAAKRTVNRQMKIKAFFLTQTDYIHMQSLTEKYQEWFWTGLRNEIINKTAFAYSPETLQLQKFKDIELKDTFLERMVNSVQSLVTSRAVVVKARQLLLVAPEAQSLHQSTRSAAMMSESSSSSNTRFDNSMSSILYRSAAVAGPHFVWRSAHDTGVCEICTPLDGSEYEIDDIDIPAPIDDTHPNCRCELELVDAEFTGEDIYESPEDFFFL